MKIESSAHPPKAILGMAGFLSGIASHGWWPLESRGYWVASIFLFASVLILGWGKSRHFRNVLVTVFAIAGGWLWFDSTIPSGGMREMAGQEVRLQGTVTNFRETTLRFEVDTLNGKSISGPGRRISIRLVDGVAAGDRMEVVCVLQLIRNTAQIPYRVEVAARRGEWIACRPQSVRIEQVAVKRFVSIPYQFARWRQKLTAHLQGQLPREEAALLGGMLYGDSPFSDEAYDRYRAAGLLHLVAVSGSNIGAVLQTILIAAFSLRLNRKISTVIAALGLGSFVLLVGFGASVLRAVVMGLLVLVARLFGRAVLDWHVLLLAAFLLCVWDPWYLVFDAGFALSFLAMWGVLRWAPVFSERLSWIPEMFGLREAIATTLGAMIMTSPYAAWKFGSIGFVGLLTNLVVAPAAPWIMGIGSVGVLVDLLSHQTWIYGPVLGFLRIVIGASRVSDVFPWMSGEISVSVEIFMVTHIFLEWVRWRFLSTGPFHSSKDVPSC